MIKGYTNFGGTQRNSIGTAEVRYLSAHINLLTWFDRVQRLSYIGHEWLVYLKCVIRCNKYNDCYSPAPKILLERHILISGQEYVKTGFLSHIQQPTIVDTMPIQPADRSSVVVWKVVPELLR